MFGGLTRLGSLRAATDRPENMRQARDAPRRILIASRSKNRHASQFRECFDRTFLGKRPSLRLTDATLDDRLPDLFHPPRFIGHLLHWQLKLFLYSVTLYSHKLLNENFPDNLDIVFRVWSTARYILFYLFITDFTDEYLYNFMKIFDLIYDIWKKSIMYLKINLQICDISLLFLIPKVKFRVKVVPFRSISFSK